MVYRDISLGICSLNKWSCVIFIVHNLTSKTIYLSDIRAEIGPKKVIDLELITTREQIERSKDVKTAIQQKKLALARYSSVNADIKVINKNKSNIDEEKLAAMVKKTIIEEMKNQNKGVNIEETISKAVNNSLGGLMSSMRERMNNLPVQGRSNPSNIPIDPNKLAELSQKTVEKLSEEIEINDSGKARKVNIINSKNRNNNADEL